MKKSFVIAFAALFAATLVSAERRLGNIDNTSNIYEVKAPVYIGKLIQECVFEGTLGVHNISDWVELTFEVYETESQYVLKAYTMKKMNESSTVYYGDIGRITRLTPTKDFIWNCAGTRNESKELAVQTKVSGIAETVSFSESEKPKSSRNVTTDDIWDWWNSIATEK